MNTEQEKKKMVEEVGINWSTKVFEGVTQLKKIYKRSYWDKIVLSINGLLC